MNNVYRIGFDIGSYFVKAVALDADGNIINKRYQAHNGKPDKIVSDFIKIHPDAKLIGVTGSGAHLPKDLANCPPIHFARALLKSVSGEHAGVRNILDLGGGSSTLIHLDENGRFINMETNSLCAAGTGAFLDEQAHRLEIDYDAMKEIPFDDDPPSIASRCAVFAKSDLIHRQQEGYSKQAMWTGLCKGCLDTCLQTLLRGRPLNGKTVVVGGVVLNPQVMTWLKKYYGDQIIVSEDGPLAAALGAAQLADDSPASAGISSNESEDEQSLKDDRAKPLTLTLSDYPSFDVLREHTDEMDNEVRIWRMPESGAIKAFLGVDIGSTSTKLTLIDSAGEIYLDIYRKTLGDPLSATQNLFIAVENFMEKENIDIEILGCATTGSGRKFIGKIIGADRIINEITSHVAGARRADPDIDTIFEIGGQDSKYMHIKGGAIREANMNYICAAGTGSFVEEQAGKLGFAVSEIGEMVEGIAPPYSSDRCTVFMEEDITKLLRRGYSRQEAIASVMYSVVKNYLNKVVGKRYVSDKKIFFQGATARNKGLVAAFENLLGVEIVVSPMCHQMGAYGVALLVTEHMKGKTKSSFRGFGLAHRNIKLTSKTCGLCNNDCKITFAHIDGESETPSWGYMCGKEPDEKKQKISATYSLFMTRNKLLKKALRTQVTPEDAPVVGIPFSLTSFSHAHFWVRLFNEIGYRVKLTEPSGSETKKIGVGACSGDFCFPVKLAVGHAMQMAADESLDHWLIPQMISNQPNDHSTNTLFCPYVQGHAAMMKSVFNSRNIGTDKLITPVYDMRWNETQLRREFTHSIAEPLGVKKGIMKTALAKAMEAQLAFEKACQDEGARFFEKINAKGEKAVVIIGRPYNCFDSMANLDLPRKIAEYGYHVVPIDFVPFDPKNLGEEYQNIYWNYGQRIVTALKYAADHPNLHCVYLTNFNCGPDSFMLSYAERIMGNKPLLILELDEHGADAGYITRVEAFLDVIAVDVKVEVGRPTFLPVHSFDDFKKRTLWIPPMHPFGSPLAAAVMRRHGYDAHALPPEDREAYEIGRQVVRGAECLPTCTTIGSLLKKFREINAVPKEHAYMMATARGPCRFGQYALLHRQILNEQGYQDTIILSPSSYNSYQGVEEKVRRDLWASFVVGDILIKMVCKVRPYEKDPGSTDRLAEHWLHKLEKAFETGVQVKQSVAAAASAFAAHPRHDLKKPLVGVVGEIYVRGNPFTNENVLRNIENFGGEAWLTPTAEWFLYTAYKQTWTARENFAGLFELGAAHLKNKFLHRVEHKMYELCQPFLADRIEPPIKDVLESGLKYFPMNFEGEAILTIGRAIEFAKTGADLVVNCAPFGCMPGTLTGAILADIQSQYHVPMVSMFYDGEGDINRHLEIFIQEAL